MEGVFIRIQAKQSPSPFHSPAKLIEVIDLSLQQGRGRILGHRQPGSQEQLERHKAVAVTRQ